MTSCDTWEGHLHEQAAHTGLDIYTSRLSLTVWLLSYAHIAGRILLFGRRFIDCAYLRKTLIPFIQGYGKASLLGSAYMPVSSGFLPLASLKGHMKMFIIA